MSQLSKQPLTAEQTMSMTAEQWEFGWSSGVFLGKLSSRLDRHFKGGPKAKM